MRTAPLPYRAGTPGRAVRSARRTESIADCGAIGNVARGVFGSARGATSTVTVSGDPRPATAGRTPEPGVELPLLPALPVAGPSRCGRGDPGPRRAPASLISIAAAGLASLVLRGCCTGSPTAAGPARGGCHGDAACALAAVVLLQRGLHRVAVPRALARGRVRGAPRALGRGRCSAGLAVVTRVPECCGRSACADLPEATSTSRLAARMARAGSGGARGLPRLPRGQGLRGVAPLVQRPVLSIGFARPDRDDPGRGADRLGRGPSAGPGRMLSAALGGPSLRAWRASCFWLCSWSRSLRSSPRSGGCRSRTARMPAPPSSCPPGARWRGSRSSPSIGTR